LPDHDPPESGQAPDRHPAKHFTNGHLRRSETGFSTASL